MLVSVKALSKLVDISNLSAEEIANGLTFAGVEVEEINKIASGTNLIIGHILKCEKHPDSDHLHVLKVDLGPKEGVVQIVCGAPNARKGLKVIVARVGAKLPQIEIKKGVIRGVESNGMCCSLLELGVDSKYLSEAQTQGIEVLPNDAPTGEEDVLGYLGLDDEVLNLKVLANRPDLLSLINVAREVGAIFNRELKLPEVKENVTFKTDLKVSSLTDKCSQFASKEVKGVVIKESPRWMKEFLRSMGVRSINNIVDIGNYVMLMTGQPLHMYDADKVRARELVARDDMELDFVALDEKTYKVIPGDILITSKGQAGCLGGVMGSLEVLVDDNTKNIFIESASFDSATIRHTSLRLGLASESSSRFVKGTNHFQAKQVLEYTAELIKDLCEAKEFSNVVEYQKEEQVTRVIPSSVTRINKRLGTKFSEEEVIGALKRVGFEVKRKDEDKFEAIVPSYRLDVTCDADLSEEVIRLLGFDNVTSILPVMDTTLGSLNERQARERNIRYYLLGEGLDECLTYSLVSEKEKDLFALVNNDKAYELLNPLTDDHKIFRKNVLHSLLKVASYNVSRQNKDLALFEVSNIITENKHETHLAIVLVGKELRQGLIAPISYDFYHMKGLVEGMMTVLGIEESRYKLERVKDSHNDELHPGRSADIILQGQKIGTFGEIHPNKLKEYDLGKTSAIVLEMNLELLLEAKISLLKAKGYSRFPVVSRDLALLVDKKVDARDILRTVKTTGKGIVKDANVFDVFEGEAIGLNNKSIAISIIFGSDDRTLSDKEVNDVEEEIKYALLKEHKAIIRS